MICSMFDNTKCPYPVILLISNHTKCLYRDIQRVYTTVLSAPRYGQCPKYSPTLWESHTLYTINIIQSTGNLSRHCRKCGETGPPASVHLCHVGSGKGSGFRGREFWHQSRKHPEPVAHPPSTKRAMPPG